MAKSPLTANQLVAYNLERIRRVRGWNQREAAERLEPHLGKKWSIAVWSGAEVSYKEGRRRREFDADEILALARAFEVPIYWFFIPPDPQDHDGSIALGEKGNSMTSAEVVEAATVTGLDEVLTRVVQMSGWLEPSTQGRVNQGLAELARQATASAVDSVLGTDVEALIGSLKNLTDALEAVSNRAKSETQGKLIESSQPTQAKEGDES